MKKVTRRKYKTRRDDGWSNVLTGMGRLKYDKSIYTVFNLSTNLQDETLEALYRQEGLTRRIIDIPARDMLREGYTINNDIDGRIESNLKRIKFDSTLFSAVKLARLFGGSVIFLGVNDLSESLEIPVNERLVKQLFFAKVYPKSRVEEKAGKFVENPMSDAFGEPEIYTLTNSDDSQIDVHRSRLLFIRNDDLNKMGLTGDWCGDSIIQSIYQAIRTYSVGMKGLEKIVYDFVQVILSIPNLQDLLMTKEGETALSNRANILDMTRDIANILFIDSEEQYMKSSTTVSGLPEIVDRMMTYVSSMTGIPTTKLFGQSPSGMNSTGESDIRNYYDDLVSYRNDMISDQVDIAVRYAALANGIDPNSITWDWNPLWQLSEKEQADIDNINSAIDEKYYRMGVLSSDEIRKIRGFDNE